MSGRKLLANIFSNWTNLIVNVAIAFFLTPILINSLGDSLYGVWVLIVSFTGYFTVLDFGVNSAIVRYISRHEASGDTFSAQRVFSTSLGLFCGIGLTAAAVLAAASPFFGNFYATDDYPMERVAIAFALIGLDIAVGFIMGVYMATLKARHEFVRVNIISITALLMKNALILWALFSGYSLITIALAQLAHTLLRFLWMRKRLANDYTFSRDRFDRPMLGQIFDYSVYSFLITVAIRLFFYTDAVLVSLVVGKALIVFYAVPMMMLERIEKLVYAMISVLTPIVSGNEARLDQGKNQAIYRWGSRYSLWLVLPVLFSFWTAGGDFIRIWLDSEEKAATSTPILRILIAGYVFYLAQVVANSVLKGISRHKVFAFILLAGAAINVSLSLWWGSVRGLEGIALGAMVALMITHGIVVPAYACRVLEINYFGFMLRSVAWPMITVVPAAVLFYYRPFHPQNYFEFFSYCAVVGLYFWTFGALVVLDPQHRQALVARFR